MARNKMILVFAVIGALVGFIPLGSFLLIPMEVYLLYSILKKYNAFDFIPFLGMSAMLIAVSSFLKGLATFLQPVPVIGQISNSVVAFGFIMILGSVAEEHYSKRFRPPSDNVARKG